MASSYPGGLDSFTNPAAGNPLNSPSHSAQHSAINDAVAAVQNELGTDPAGTFDTVSDRFEGLDKLIWQDARLPQVMAPIVSSEYWGVYGDGSDETAEVQNCVDEATANQAIILWPGMIQGTGITRVVAVSDTINVPNGCRMIGGRFDPINQPVNFPSRKPVFSWPTGTLNTGWWTDGYIIDAGRPAGDRTGTAIRCSVQQGFVLRDMEIEGFDVALKIRGQVGRVEGLDVSGCNIGVLMNQDVKSIDFINTSLLCAEAGVRFSVIGDNGTPGSGMNVGGPKFSFWGVHTENSALNDGVILFDLEAAAMVTIRDVYSTMLGAPNSQLLRMRDNVHSIGLYRSCYSIENVLSHGSSLGGNDYKAVQDDYRTETVMMQADWGGVFMDKYFRREDV